MSPKDSGRDSPEARKTIKAMVCLVCRRTPVDVDHILTRGANGECDFIIRGGRHILNLWPLCRECHTKRHTIGIKTFIGNSRACREYLKDISHPILDDLEVTQGEK